MTLVADSYSPVDGHALADAGYAGTMLYLGTTPSAKLATAARIDTLLDAGRSFGFVFENDTTDMDGGGPAGYRNASAAVWEVAALFGQVGLPDPTGSMIGIYLADDNPTLSPGAGAYMAAAHGVISAHGMRTGWYGNQAGAVFLLGAGVVELGWGVSSWGADLLGRCHLRQEANVPTRLVGGTPVDTNTALAADWGQYPRP